MGSSSPQMAPLPKIPMQLVLEDGTVMVRTKKKGERERRGEREKKKGAKTDFLCPLHFHFLTLSLPSLRDAQDGYSFGAQTAVAGEVRAARKAAEKRERRRCL